MGRGESDEGRAIRLTYTIPAEDLPAFWHDIMIKANASRVQTRRGEPAVYLKTPRCCYRRTT